MKKLKDFIKKPKTDIPMLVEVDVVLRTKVDIQRKKDQYTWHDLVDGLFKMYLEDSKKQLKVDGMTIQKLAKMVQAEIIENDLDADNFNVITTDRITIILSGLALLVDSEADPDCVFTDKVNIVLNDLARDIRSGK